MRTHFHLCSTQKAIAFVLIAGVTALWCSSANAFQTQIFTEAFDGGTGARLDETTEDLSGAIWSANGFATDNGVLDVGDGTTETNLEGSATLPITLELDGIYTVDLDVTSNAAEWVGLGFSENPPTLELDGNGDPLTSAVPNRPQDRFAQSGGRAWFLYRPGEIGAGATTDQIQIFGGAPGAVNAAGTQNPIDDIDTDFSGATVQRTLTVVLNTDSAGFTADFLVDGASQSMGPQPLFNDIDATIPLTDPALLSNVGFTWEGQSPGGAAGAITVDNFSVSTNLSAFLLGDVNLDGAVNFLDISAFIAVLQGGGFQLEADTNGDGAVNFLDISAFIALL